jgi:hypothetical protein
MWYHVRSGAIFSMKVMKRARFMRRSIKFIIVKNLLVKNYGFPRRLEAPTVSTGYRPVLIQAGGGELNRLFDCVILGGCAECLAAVLGANV